MTKYLSLYNWNCKEILLSEDWTSFMNSGRYNSKGDKTHGHPLPPKKEEKIELKLKINNKNFVSQSIILVIQASPYVSQETSWS